MNKTKARKLNNVRGNVFQSIEDETLFYFENEEFRNGIKHKNIIYQGESNTSSGNQYLKVKVDKTVVETYIELLQLKRENETIYDFHGRFEILFLKKLEDFKKFKGDFTELVFFYLFGGIKQDDRSDYDFDLNGKYIEVKSYVRGGNSKIHVKYTQLKSNYTIVAVPFENNDGGESIISLCDLILNKTTTDIEWVLKIRDKYINDELVNHRYKINEEDVLEYKLSLNIIDELGKMTFFTKATFEIPIFDPKNSEVKPFHLEK